jgi:hypothetical protein
MCEHAVRRVSLAVLALMCGSAWQAAHADYYESDDFTWSDPTGGKRTADDFRLTIAGFFIKQPTIPGFSKQSPDIAADFAHDHKYNNNSVVASGGAITDGSKVNVKFEGTGVDNNPMGKFSIGGTEFAAVPSKGLNGINLAFVPVGPGDDFAVTLVNNFDTPLTGSVSVYVNSGWSTTTLSNFDQLNNPTLVFSDASYSLNPAELLTTINGNLPTPNDYILIVGTADNGGGSDSFSVAFSPQSAQPVSEPGTLALLTSGLPLLLLRHRRLLSLFRQIKDA